MERNPLISVIVPVYNVESYLPRCVDSLLTQTYENLEIILVDDGSQDASGSICDRYAGKDARIRVIHKENGGLSSARNAGLDAASGEYIGFVDSDDWMEPDAYAVMLGLMEKYDAQLVCAGRYDVNAATGQSTVGLCPVQEECISGEALAGRIFLFDNCDSSACDKLYRRELLDGLRYPEGRVCEDMPVTYRVALRAERVVMCDKPVYNYFHRAGSITQSIEITEKTFHYSQNTQEIYPYIQKNYPNIAPQARYLRVHSLAHILLLLSQSDRETRRKYAPEYRHARRELTKHWRFFLTYPRFRFRERVTDLLLVLGLYRLLRPLFTAKKLETT